MSGDARKRGKTKAGLSNARKAHGALTDAVDGVFTGTSQNFLFCPEKSCQVFFGIFLCGGGVSSYGITSGDLSLRRFASQIATGCFRRIPDFECTVSKVGWVG